MNEPVAKVADCENAMINDKQQLDAIVERIMIRSEMREKLVRLWHQSFEDLHQALKETEGIEFYLQLHHIWASEGTVELFNWFVGPALLISEIFDDWRASYLCFLHGFTKQAQGVLRNTVELVVQLYYLRFLQATGQPTKDAWSTGDRGIEKIDAKLSEITKQSGLLEQGDKVRLNQLYNLLCQSTHSHKRRMTALNVPKVSPIEEPVFEPCEVIYTKGLLLYVIDLESSLITSYLQTAQATEYLVKVLEKLTRLKNIVSKHAPLIARFGKGYLVHREHAVVNGKQILFSVDLNGNINTPGKKITLSEDDRREFQRQVDERLITDRKG